MKRTTGVRWSVVLALLLPAAPAFAQVVPDSGAFLSVLGSDTIALERFILTPTQLQVEALTRVPQTRLLYLTVSWDAGGRLTGYQMIDAPAPASGGPARVRTIAALQGDSLRIEVVQGSGTPRVRYMHVGADVPLISPLYSLYAAALRRHAREPTIRMLGQAGLIAYAAAWKPDSLTLTPPQGGSLRIGLDSRGQMTWLDGRETTFKVRVQPTAWPDVQAVATMFAQRDARGQPLGTLSPRDTARATLSGFVMTIDYGRPAVRGRLIFGEVVPWDRVWRTGANAATRLEITRDVQFGDVVVPAGVYSLWTIPGRRQWQLVINRQSGQWGTEYDESRDVARIPIEVRTVRDHVERFTIDIDAQGFGGIVRLTWERTQAMAPFTVR